MILKLLERDREEALRISSRTLTFPDGIARSVPAWRMVWRWYDALLAYEFCPSEAVLLGDVLKHTHDCKLPVGEALGQVVQTYVLFIEASGGDVTDDDMRTMISAR